MEPARRPANLPRPIAAPWRRRLAGLLACALLLAGQPSTAQLPTLGDGSDMTLGAERKLGDRIAREIYRDPDFVDDPLLTDYVQGIWEPLKAAARQRGELSPEMDERFAWDLMLIRDRSVNAFALPGGYMGVHLGLIAVVANRDELASVLAHELSHITQRHISRLNTKQGQQTPWVIAAMVLGALAASKSPNAANAVIAGSQAMAVQSQLNFSRDMEREADRIGYNVMTQAGYEPVAFVTMFEKLQQASRLNDNGGYPYLRSHPLTSQRIADMQLRVSSGEPSARPAARGPLVGAPNPMAMPSAAWSSAMTHGILAARARILSDPGVDALRAWLGEADGGHGVLIGTSTALPAQARQVAVLYGAVLASQKLRDYSAAQRYLARLQPLARVDAGAARLVRLMAVELALQSGDAPLALSQLDTAATDRPELLLLAQAAVQLKKQTLAAGGGGARISGSPDGLLGDVLQRLQVWVTAHPDDGSAWQNLASVAGAQNLPLRAIRAEAEAQVAYQDFPAAVDRLRAAQDFARKSGLGVRPGDYIEASIIDTRLRQVEAISRELAREQALQR